MVSIVKKVCNDIYEFFDELLDECLKGSYKHNYKQVAVKEKIEFDDDEIGPPCKKKLLYDNYINGIKYRRKNSKNEKKKNNEN